jgi:hypothetical protein
VKSPEPTYTLEQWKDWHKQLLHAIANGGSKEPIVCEYEPGKTKIFRVPPQSPVWAFSDAAKISWDRLSDAGLPPPGGDAVGALLVALVQSAFLVGTIGAISPAILPTLGTHLSALYKAAKFAGIETPGLVDIVSSGVGGNIVELLKQFLAFFLKNPGELIAKAVKLVAEGKIPYIGATLQKAYLALAGKKTYIGLAFGVVYGALSYLCSAAVPLPFDACVYADWAVKISVVMVTIGLLDGAVRATPPVK